MTRRRGRSQPASLFRSGQVPLAAKEQADQFRNNPPDAACTPPRSGDIDITVRPSEALQDQVEAVRAIIARYPMANPRIFCSVARGEDGDASKLDLLLDALPGTSYFDLAGLQLDLEALLRVPVDVLTPPAIGARIAQSITRDLRSL